MTAGTWDAIVIGSGVSSLTAGLFLARAGRKVLILERYEKPGGYLHCFERYGHRFDTGAHYTGAIGEGEPFRALLQHLGVWREDLFIPLAADGFDVMRFKDFEVRMPRGYGAVVEALSAQFPTEAPAIRDYFALVAQAAATFTTYNFALVDQDDDRIAELTSVSLESVVRQRTAHPRLQCVLYAYCALHGVAPRDVSFGMHAILCDSLIRGAWGFAGGGERLVDSYLTELRRHGAEIRTSAGVVELKTDGRRVTAVRLASGEVLHASRVISGIHPKATFRLLSAFRPTPAFRHRLEATAETVGLLGIYAVARDEGLIDRDRNYYFFDWNEPEAFQALARDGEPLPPAAFMCPADRTGRQGATAIPLSVHALASYDDYATFDRPGTRRRPRSYHETKLAAVERTLAFVDGHLPGLKASLLKCDASTPLSNLWFNGSEEGSPYGIYHSIQNTGPRAFGPRTHVENLLLTGQSSLFPGILGAAISGLRTAGNLIGIKNILRDLSPLVKPLVSCD